MVEKVYCDYCKDSDVTREQRHAFNDFVQDMIRFSEVLRKEAREKSVCTEVNLPLEGKISFVKEQQGKTLMERETVKKDFGRG